MKWGYVVKSLNFDGKDWCIEHTLAVSSAGIKYCLVCHSFIPSDETLERAAKDIADDLDDKIIREIRRKDAGM